MPRTYGTTNAAPYAAAPAVGPAGDTYYNTANKSLYLSDGTAWNPDQGPELVTVATDFNACTSTGIYSISNMATNGPTFANAGLGGAVGILQVWATDATHINQMWMGGSNSSQPDALMRSCNAGTWSSWESVFGRLNASGSFAQSVPNGIYGISGTATGGPPGVSGNGILTSWGQPLGTGGGQANTVQTWVSYTTGEAWQRTNVASGGFTAWYQLPLAASCIVEKVWSGTAYVWPNANGTAPPANSYTNILFTDPTGTHDPTTSTGGRTTVNDLWEPGGLPNLGIVSQTTRSLLGAWGSTSGTTYVRFGGLTWPVTVTKQNASTNLIFEVGVSGWITVAGPVEIGYSTADTVGTVVRMGVFFFNDTGTHRMFTSLGIASGLAAASYSCSIWTRVASGAGVWQSDANDILWLKV